MTAELRYRPDSNLGERFPNWVIAAFPTAEIAEKVRVSCPNADSIHVVEEN